MDSYEKLTWLKQWYEDNKAELNSDSALISAIKKNSLVESIIRNLYHSLFNKTLGGCGNCLADAMAVLYHFSNNKMKEIMECKYKLRNGVLLSDPNCVLPNVTSANITNDLAEAYLRDNPAREKMFDTLPDDWEERVAKSAEPKPGPGEGEQPGPGEGETEKTAGMSNKDNPGEPQPKKDSTK